MLKIISALLISFFVVILISCNANNTTNQNTGQVEKLFAALKDNTVRVEQIIDEHFLYANQLKQDGSENSTLLLGAYTTKLKALRADLNHQKCEIYPWEVAEQKNPAANKDLPQSAVAQQDVFVIFVQDQPKYYIKIQDEKLQSLMPMLKGDLITGWL